MCVYSDSLIQLLKYANIEIKPAYSTGDICKILNISMTKLLSLCDEWEPTNNNTGLECYYTGSHRRIPHHTLIKYLELNSHYNKSKLL